MRIIVCDDDRTFGMELTSFIKNKIITSNMYNDDFKINYIHSAKELISYLLSHDVDILFLDVSMPEVDGFDVAKFICDNELSIYIIFVSGFENNVFYSLRYRPFRFIRKEKYQDEVIEALKSAYTESLKKYTHIMITKHNDILPIRISRIIYVEKEKRGNYLMIFSLDDVYRYRGTLSEFETLVSSSNFIKPSANAFINIEHINCIQNNIIYLKGGHTYHMTSPKYQNSVIQAFFKFMREE